MSESLKQLVNSYTLPVDADRQRAREQLNEKLFALEKGGTAGKALLADFRCSSDSQYPEFMPEGLAQTYTDRKTGREFPVFAILPLNSQSSTITYEVKSDQPSGPRVEFHPALNALKCFSHLRQYLVGGSVIQNVLWRNNKRLAVQNIVTFGIFLTLLFGVFTGISLLKGRALSLAMFYGAGADEIWGLTSIVGFALLVSTLILCHENWLSSFRSLMLTAHFDGLLPQEVREKARQVAAEFDDLFLVTDQRERWDCTVLPSQQPPNPDPILIGSQKVDHSWRYYLIGVFELTTVESYLGANSANE